MDESITLHGGDGIERSALDRLFPPLLDYPVPSIDQIGLASTGILIDEIGGMGERGRGNVELNGDSWKYTYPDDDVALWSAVCDLLIAVRDTWSMLGPAVREVAGLLALAVSEAEVSARRGVALQRSAFVLEAGEQYVVQIGHLMANAALRMAIGDANDRELLGSGDRKQTEKVLTAIAAGEQSFTAWPFHSFVVKVRPLLDSSTSGAADCVRAVADLYEKPSWAVVSESRNQWFHRARTYAMGDPGEQASVEQRFSHLATALSDARHELRAFALGCDHASPRCDGFLLFARTTEQRFDLESGQVTEVIPQRTNLDVIRECS